MLKFFRKYNKWILAVGASILMVAFLMPMQRMGQRSDADQVIGEVGGQEMTYGQRRRAGGEMGIILDLSGRQLPVPMSEESRGEPDPLAWLLILHDAERLGLYASDAQVAAMRSTLAQMMGTTDEKLVQQVASVLHVSLPELNEALRHWLIYQRYQELMLGLAHVPLEDRLGQYMMVGRVMQAGMFDMGIRLYQSAQGQPRLSRPLVEHVVSEQRARVEIEALKVDARRYLAQIQDPSEEELNSLYETYKGNLQGQSEPYGFGYRYPDRVKIEFLVLPLDRLVPQVTVEEADIYSFYEKNKATFVEVGESLPPDAQGKPQPAPPSRQKSYGEVREQIREQLTKDAANKLGSDMVKAAVLLLNDNARQLHSDESGYKVTGEFQPMPLVDVADQLQRQFGVRTDVIREDSRWLDAKELAELPGIGTSALIGERDREGASFVQYVLSSREIADPEDRSPLIMLRLQAKLPSQPLVSPVSGDRYLFRLIEAQRSHEPAALDEVRDAVTQDARRLAAYKKLLDDQASWANQLSVKTMAALQLELNTEFIRPAPFPKRVDTVLGTDVPEIPGLGKSEELVDRVFALADRVMEAGGPATAPPALATDVIPIDREQALVLVRLLDYQPITRSNFEVAASDPRTSAAVLQAVVERSGDPLSRKTLIERTGYTGSGAEAESQTSPTAPPAPAPAPEQAQP